MNTIHAMHHSKRYEDELMPVEDIQENIKWMKFLARVQPERAPELASRIEALEQTRILQNITAEAQDAYFDGFREAPAPLAEQVADEAARVAHWLGTEAVSEPAAQVVKALQEYDDDLPGTRFVISGGEVLELGNFHNPDDEIPF